MIGCTTWCISCAMHLNDTKARTTVSMKPAKRIDIFTRQLYSMARLSNELCMLSNMASMYRMTPSDQGASHGHVYRLDALTHRRGSQ